MRSSPLLFFALAVLGTLIGLTIPLPVLALPIVLCATVVSFFLALPRIVKALLVSITVILALASLATTQKRAFDEVLERLPLTQTVVEGVLRDLSDTLNGEKVGTLDAANATLILRLKEAASAKPMCIGDRVRVRGKIAKAQPSLSPGQLDGYLFGLARGVHGRIIVSNPNHVAVMENPNGPSYVAQIKQALKDHLVAHLTPREVGLILALIVSDLRMFDNEQQQVYRNIGAGHLLGVSGLQVSLLSSIFFRAFLFIFLLVPWISRRSVARYPTLVVTLALVWGFVLLCDAPPAAVRAGLMTTLMLFASACAWPTTSADVLGATGLLCLLLFPAWVVDPSFWLSFAAVFGIILAAEYAKIPDDQVLLMHLEKNNAPIKSKWRRAVLMSLGAGVLTLPFSIYYFSELSVSGLFLNLLIVPISGILQTPAIFLVAFGFLFNLPILSEIGAFLVSALEMICMTMDDWLGRTYPVMPIFFAELVVAVVAGIVLITLAHANRRMLKGTVLAACVMFLVWPSVDADEVMVATFIPVGQGDGAVLQIPPGKTLVIDGGGNFENLYNPGERVIAPFLRRRGIDKIDVVVLSHPDADHLMGLIWLIENFEVEELWHSNFDDSHPLMAKLLHAAKRRGVRVRSQDELPDRIGNAQLTYFKPKVRDSLELNTTNNRSLVMRVSYGATSVLLPGDVETPLEDAIRGADLRATIVKAPHHGSKSSSSPDFVRATKAAHVVFCTGVNNRFGFPHSQVIKRWQDSGATLWDTAYNGETTFRLDGKSVQVKPFRSRTPYE